MPGPRKFLEEERFRVLAPDGGYSCESILILHKSIFPVDFPWVASERSQGRYYRYFAQLLA